MPDSAGGHRRPVVRELCGDRGWLDVGRDLVRRQRRVLRRRPRAVPGRARRRAPRRARARRAWPAPRRRLRSRIGDAAARAAVRGGGRCRRRPGHGRRGVPPRPRGRRHRRRVAAPAGRGPAGRSRHLPRRHVRPVLPLDGPGAGRPSRPRHARAGRRLGPRRRLHRRPRPDEALPHPRPPWDRIHELVARYLGPVRRAGQGLLPGRDPGRRGGGPAAGRLHRPDPDRGGRRPGRGAWRGRRRRRGVLPLQLGAAPVRRRAAGVRGRPPRAAGRGLGRRPLRRATESRARPGVAPLTPWAPATRRGRMRAVGPREFTATLADDGRGRAFVAVPFDPDEVWAVKPRHHVTGSVNGFRVRGVIETRDGRRGFSIGAAWLRDRRDVAIGDTVAVVLAPEGPQRDELDDDVAAALDGEPPGGRVLRRAGAVLPQGVPAVDRRREASSAGAGRAHRRAGAAPGGRREAAPETLTRRVRTRCHRDRSSRGGSSATCPGPRPRRRRPRSPPGRPRRRCVPWP